MARKFRGLRTIGVAALAAMLWSSGGEAGAHFQLLIPSSPSVYDVENSAVTLDLRFTHPMAGGPLMSMGAPVRFAVSVDGETTELLGALRRTEIDAKSVYSATVTIDRPGVHTFILEPAPYYEAAEKTFIVQYAKVMVDGYGGGGPWSEPLGLPAEIVPLSRPFGLWTGNVFRGIALRDGRPEPGAVVEVEYLNVNGQVTLPNPSYETQVTLANGQGEFIYAMPREGWWGFAAVFAGEQTMTAPDGREASVELGGVMWVYVRDME